MRAAAGGARAAAVQRSRPRGWAFVLLVLALLVPGASGRCPNLCSGQGECSPYGVCVCNTGYQGADCSEYICPSGPAWSDMPTATDKAHALAECSNRGICDRHTGVCACQKGFTGAACNRQDCPSKCSGTGLCYSMSELASRTLDIYGNSYTYSTNWDADMIRGCVCDPKMGNFDCSGNNCPRGDDPLTTGQVNQIQLLRCVASAGSFALYYYGFPSAQIQASAAASDRRSALLAIPLITGASLFSLPSLRPSLPLLPFLSYRALTLTLSPPLPPSPSPPRADVKVTFSPGIASVCSITANVIQIEFTQQFGNNPPLKPLVDATMSAAGGKVVVNTDGLSFLQDYRYLSYRAVVGTKENAICSGRGLCSADGTCACFSTNGDSYASSNGYGQPGTRGDCGRIFSGLTVATCPGQVQCSGHGICNKVTRACLCQTGWEGGDCSLRACPRGLSWFDYPTGNNVAHATYALCSNAGTCDYTTGNCMCHQLYAGQACDRMVCGGGMTCNGHGTCKTMNELAQWATKNGDALSITYGANPNNPATWDGNRMMSCLCDPGYTGYDCSLQTCPAGDDPATYNDHVEVQLLQCNAAKGFFKLKFRQEVTRAISVNATAVEVAAALQELPNIAGRVDVWFTQDLQWSSRAVQPPLVNPATIKTFNKNGTAVKSLVPGPPVWSPGTVAPSMWRSFPSWTLFNSTGYPIKSFGKVDPLDLKELQKELSWGFPDWAQFNESGVSGLGGGTLLEMQPEPDLTVNPLSVPSAACSTTPGEQTMIVSFASTHGNLPPLTADRSKMTLPGGSSFTVLTDGAFVNVPGPSASGGATTTVKIYSVSGTTETAVCNNHGLCNTGTGQCSCFADWLSSDGAGGEGTLGDCGYRVELKPVGGADFQVATPPILKGGVATVYGKQLPESQYPGAVGPGEQQRNMGPLDLRGK